MQTANITLPAAMPLTMSSIEIAGLTGKAHKHVLADVRKMMAALDRQPAEFSARYLDGKGEARECFHLPQRETMILVSGYSVPMRAAIIDRWRSLEAAIATGTSAPVLVGDMGAEVRRAIGGIVKGVVHSEIANAITSAIPAMLSAAIAAQSVVIRRGKTAGQIWRDHGFPKLKVTCWFGNRLSEVGCQIEGGGRGELGLTRARLYDPDKADVWLRNGGAILVEQKIAERKGQTVLRLVQPGPAEVRPTA